MLSSCSTAKPDLLFDPTRSIDAAQSMEIKLNATALQYTRTWPKKHPAFDACVLPCSTQQAGVFSINLPAGYVRLGWLAAIHHYSADRTIWKLIGGIIRPMNWPMNRAGA